MIIYFYPEDGDFLGIDKILSYIDDLNELQKAGGDVQLYLQDFESKKKGICDLDFGIGENDCFIRVSYSDIQKSFVNKNPILLKELKNIIRALFEGKDVESLIDLKEEKEDDKAVAVKVTFKSDDE